MKTTVLDRRVGFEFEHVSNLRHADMASTLVKAGVGVDRYATGHARCPQGCYDGWQVKTDGSISPNPPKFPNSIELVSPPLALRRIAQVKKVLQIATEHGGVNSSCGMHLHVEARDLADVSRPGERGITTIHLSDKRLLKFTGAWAMVEPTLVNYLPPSRRWSSYAQHGINYTERYRALNLTPLAQRGTVEFRMHNSTLNWQKAMAWAGLCAHIIDKLVEVCRADATVDKFIQPIDPKFKVNCGPMKFKAKVGELLLHRADDKWAIENKKEIIEEPTLRQAFEHQRERLGLKGANHLVAFNYPTYGNAMSKLCDTIGLVGPYRGYVEDRYDHMIVRHGYVEGGAPAIQVIDDEADYFNEPA